MRMATGLVSLAAPPSPGAGRAPNPLPRGVPSARARARTRSATAGPGAQGWAIHRHPGVRAATAGAGARDGRSTDVRHRPERVRDPPPADEHLWPTENHERPLPCAP